MSHRYTRKAIPSVTVDQSKQRVSYLATHRKLKARIERLEKSILAISVYAVHMEYQRVIDMCRDAIFEVEK